MDFLIIGAMKSGTSTLWALVRDHPDVWMPMPKELPFFNGPDYRLGWDEFARRNLRGAPEGAKIGKATPAYMAGAAVDGAATTHHEREIPERIAAQFPDISLIAIVRDPVERALSHYTMARNLGIETRDPQATFEELLEPAVLEASRLDPHRLQGYVVLGEYARILRGYLDVFPASQLLVVSTDELAADPTAVLASVWDFIGVRQHTPADPHARYMVSSELTRRHRIALGILDPRRPSVRAVRRAARALPPAVGAPLRRAVWTPALRYVTSGGGEQPAGPPARGFELPAALHQRLVDHYVADSAEFEDLFGFSPLVARRPAAA